MRIFLTGLPGSGKTYLGKLWAADNGLSFYDLDELIVEEERMSIEKIFAVNGEDYFREKEAAVLRNTDRFENCIVACGGGTPCFFDNMDWMNRNGITVFLNEQMANISHHIMNDSKIRPMFLAKTPEEFRMLIRKMAAMRYPVYSQSLVIVSPPELNRTGFAYIQKNIK